MKRMMFGLIAVLTVMALYPALANAQARERWRLDWENDAPQMYVHRQPNGTLEEFWYVTYRVTNNCDQIVPTDVDVMLYTESGKDLQHDIKKVDLDTLKDVQASPEKSEELFFGRFYNNVVIAPHIERDIIAKDARFRNRSPGIIEESVENFKKGDAKGNRYYLNPRDMRMARIIHPGQTFHGIAIFRNIDPLAQVLELHISGLKDPVRIDVIEEFETKMHYENVVLRVRYRWPGDPYEREGNQIFRVRHDWMKKRIGPIASKDTVRNLVNGLLDTYKREKEWKDEGKTEEELKALRAEHRITPLDVRIMARVVRLSTGKDFGYDEALDIMANEKAVWRIHEWWVTYESRLLWNNVLNRFEIRDEKLPGEYDRDEAKD